MVKVTVDSTLPAHLGQIDTALEICDADGQTVGYFHPAVSRSAREAWPNRSPFFDEELQQRRQQRTGRPLGEILGQLGRL